MTAQTFNQAKKKKIIVHFISMQIKSLHWDKRESADKKLCFYFLYLFLWSKNAKKSLDPTDLYQKW